METNDIIASTEQWIMEEEENRKGYLKRLDDAIRHFCKKKSAAASNKILFVLLEGIKGNYSLLSGAILDTSWTHAADREYYRDRKNHKYLTAYSNYKTMPQIISENQSLRGLIRVIEADADCKGLVINPGQKNHYFIKKDLLKEMLNAGCTVAHEEWQTEKEVIEQDCQAIDRLMIQPPISAKSFESIASVIRKLEGSDSCSFTIHVNMKNDLPFSIILTKGDKMHILIKSFALPLLSEKVKVFHHYKDLEVDEVIETLRRLFLYNEPIELIEYIFPEFYGDLEKMSNEKEFVRFWNEVRCKPKPHPH